MGLLILVQCQIELRNLKPRHDTFLTVGFKVLVKVFLTLFLVTGSLCHLECRVTFVIQSNFIL